MDVAILMVGAIAAVAAVATVTIQLRQQRQRVVVRFTGGWSGSGGSIAFDVRVANRSQVAIYDVEVYSGPRGMRLDANYLVGKVASLQPATDREFAVAVPRPAVVDIGAGDGVPTFAAPWIVAVRFGPRLIVIEHPAGPFSSDAAHEGKHELTR